MVNLRTVFVLSSAFILEAWCEHCLRYPRPPIQDGIPVESAGSSSHNDKTKTTVHQCAYGCCETYDNPCCEAPFYTGTAFVITIISCILIPTAVSIALCLVIRGKRQEQQRRSERRRRRRQERNHIFFAASEYGPQVVGPPPPPTTTTPDLPSLFGMMPPAYSEEAVPESANSQSAQNSAPPPPPYTRIISTTSTETLDSEDDDDDNDKRYTTIPETPSAV